MKAWIGLGCVAALIALAGCGGDDSGGSTGDGCTTDDECKGDRICVDKECVDPGTTGGDGDGDGDSGDGDGDGDGDSGEGGTSGMSGAGSGGTMDNPELEAACSADCEARHAAGCEMNIGSLDQCLGQCLIVDEYNYGYCLDERRDQYACLAAGGYTCVMGYPQPMSTCIAELTALSGCTQAAPCRVFCDQAAGECAPEGEACITDCEEKTNGFEDSICSIYYTQLLSCWTTNGVMCDGDKPAIGNCEPQVAEIADCIGSRNTDCDGFCWAADMLGCGSTDCVTDCQAEIDNTYCGSYYRSVIDCAIGSHNGLNASCQGGVLTPDATECASYIEQHEMCLSTSPEQ
jgi:hypothetical protein